MFFEQFSQGIVLMLFGSRFLNRFPNISQFCFFETVLGLSDSASFISLSVVCSSFDTNHAGVIWGAIVESSDTEERDDGDKWLLQVWSRWGY